ncbi:hypothetical protein BN1723_016221 [Verticillium longisporum]|uniref:Uncharacterized protein n=1 Tax=Verticillium longisporum TaxID=100787 RepID=A0A0G4LVN6_VERLO|nr:hypothetical protein BN1708_004095 [Verticillium longisporum]CRK43596.1 hypothetical protein BN1723_016221 [Verticillium longisporum]
MAVRLAHHGRQKARSSLTTTGREYIEHRQCPPLLQDIISVNREHGSTCISEKPAKPDLPPPCATSEADRAQYLAPTCESTRETSAVSNSEVGGPLPTGSKERTMPQRPRSSAMPAAVLSTPNGALPPWGLSPPVAMIVVVHHTGMTFCASLYDNDIGHDRKLTLPKTAAGCAQLMKKTIFGSESEPLPPRTRSNMRFGTFSSWVECLSCYFTPVYCDRTMLTRKQTSIDESLRQDVAESKIGTFWPKTQIVGHTVDIVTGEIHEVVP